MLMDKESEEPSVHTLDNKMLGIVSDFKNKAPKASRIMFGVPAQICLGMTRAGVKLYLQKPTWDEEKKIWDHWRVLDGNGGTGHADVLNLLVASSSSERDLSSRMREYFDLSKIPVPALAPFSSIIMGCREVDKDIRIFQSGIQPQKSEEEIEALEATILPTTFRALFRVGNYFQWVE